MERRTSDSREPMVKKLGLEFLRVHLLSKGKSVILLPAKFKPHLLNGAQHGKPWY